MGKPATNPAHRYLVDILAEDLEASGRYTSVETEVMYVGEGVEGVMDVCTTLPDGSREYYEVKMSDGKRNLCKAQTQAFKANKAHPDTKFRFYLVTAPYGRFREWRGNPDAHYHVEDLAPICNHSKNKSTGKNADGKSYKICLFCDQDVARQSRHASRKKEPSVRQSPVVRGYRVPGYNRS